MKDIKVTNEQINVVLNDEKAAKRKKIDNRKTLAFLRSEIECDMHTYGKTFRDANVYFAFCAVEKKYGGEIEMEFTPNGNTSIVLRFKCSMIGALIKTNEHNRIERMILSWKHKGVTKRRDFYYFNREHNKWFKLERITDEEIEKLISVLNDAA